MPISDYHHIPQVLDEVYALQPETVLELENRLKVIGQAKSINPKRPRILVQCLCGSPPKAVDRYNFRIGKIRSCGCIRKENSAKLIEVLHDGSSRLSHGHSIGNATPEYHSWCQMKARCLNKAHPRFKDWGGRGIRICPQWVDDFAQFLKDVGPRPAVGYSIDRFPDNDGNYEPGNVRWATAAQQRANRRDSCR